MVSKFDRVTNDGLERLLSSLLGKPLISDDDKLKVNEIINELNSRKGRLIGLNKDEQIKIILEEFDFNHAHRVFKSMGYTLFMGNIDDVTNITNMNIGSEIPSEEYLRDLCKRLLNEVWDMEESEYYSCSSIGTARFKASRGIYNGYKILGLEFIPISMVLDYDWVVDGD